MSGAHGWIGRGSRTLASLVASVGEPNAADPVSVSRHLDSLTKPVGSLGRLETIAARLAMIYGDPPPPFRARVVFVLAGDHGVAAHGVSAYPAEVTGQMCRNFAAGGAAICVLARQVGARVVAADFGVAADVGDVEGLTHAKIRRGTHDLSRRAAMSPVEARRAVLRGARLFQSQRPRPDLVGIGEMGIGNSTSAAAITTALTRASAGRVTGRGTGVSDAALRIKRRIVSAAVARIPRDADAWRVLCEVGGLEIAGLAGVVIAAAAARRAVIVDGFIATAAAAIAVEICPPVRGYLLASHRSREPGHTVLLTRLGLEPFLELGMRLGEGTGAALAMPVVGAAAGILREMATFASAGVSERTRERAT